MEAGGLLGASKNKQGGIHDEKELYENSPGSLHGSLHANYHGAFFDIFIGCYNAQIRAVCDELSFSRDKHHHHLK